MDGILTAMREGGWTHVEFSAIRASAAEAVALCRRLRSEGIEVMLHNYFPPAGRAVRNESRIARSGNC